MKTIFVYTAKSGKEYRIDVEEYMKEYGYADKGYCMRCLMNYWIGYNKHFEEV